MNAKLIGQVAGVIWKYLDRYGETSLPWLVETLCGPRFDSSVVYAGIGWLAREGKITFLPGFGAKILVILNQGDPVV